MLSLVESATLASRLLAVNHIAKDFVVLMANIKSQIKRNRQTIKATLRNRSVKSELHTYKRKFLAAVDAGDVELATSALRDVNRKYDIAVSKGVLHKRTAANKKSGLAARLNKLTAAA